MNRVWGGREGETVDFTSVEIPYIAHRNNDSNRNNILETTTTCVCMYLEWNYARTYMLSVWWRRSRFRHFTTVLGRSSKPELNVFSSSEDRGGERVIVIIARVRRRAGGSRPLHNKTLAEPGHRRLTGISRAIERERNFLEFYAGRLRGKHEDFFSREFRPFNVFGTISPMVSLRRHSCFEKFVGRYCVRQHGNSVFIFIEFRAKISYTHTHTHI